MYQYAENEDISSICSGEMCDLKIPQSGWLKAFWPISQEQHFSKQQICTGTQELNFYYRTNSGEINDQIFL